MRLDIIDEKNMAVFRELDLFNMLPRMNLGESLVLGISDEIDEDNRIAVGLVICRRIAKSLVIEWLWIQPEYRNLGIGQEVLHRLAKFAKEMGMLKIGAYFVESANRVLFCNNARQYFKNQGFFTEVTQKGEWHTQLRQIVNSDYFKESVSNVRIIPLKNVESDLRKKYVARLLDIAGAMRVTQLDINNSSIDFDLIFVYQVEKFSFFSLSKTVHQTQEIFPTDIQKDQSCYQC